MGLHYRKRRIKLRMPEIVGLTLMVLFCLSSVFAYRQFAQSGWIKTSAVVRAVSLPKDGGVLYSPISATQNGIAVIYDYHVGGRMHTGTWHSDWLSTPMFVQVSPELVSVLRGVESVSVTNLPTKAQDHLSLKVESEISKPAQEAAKSLRGEDYYNVSAVRRKSLAGILPEDANRSQSQVRQNQQIQIRYNPSRPDESRLNYPGFNLRMPAMLIFFLVLVMTVLYFGKGYPELKQRGF